LAKGREGLKPALEVFVLPATAVAHLQQRFPLGRGQSAFRYLVRLRNFKLQLRFGLDALRE
jgi:hypothetical protein